ncbi:hypothetical protein [[Mycobacterium] burgundiense]|uniref:Uncharacterized protein n=1 Tax=[Mycobacterium] burgundiense TaxID=3064286 RepID=A0ABM9LBZ5_9MYCO|nr:hypothetical protein [Mycolicibacterium sp. MU0053]CAJ1496485.1 hypothetical protein MU0053_000665 [Mycolicibacterium sp. MU0053]
MAVAIRVRESHIHSPQLTVFVHHTHQAQAQEVLDRLMARSAALSPYRDRAVGASHSGGLNFTVIDVEARAGEQLLTAMVVCLIAAGSALTAGETRDVPTEILGHRLVPEGELVRH